MTKPYSLKKCRQVFKEAVMRHKKLMHRLSSDLLASFEHSLEELNKAIVAKDSDSARMHAFEVEQFLQAHGKKNLFDHSKEFVVAIILALIIAALVRQMWFELYEIPSGSMRPTFRESDRVFVFKDSFCINKPFETAHFYFQPDLVKHGSIVVITGDKLDLPDVDTVYFGLFPGKRRYVKRVCGKDGDILYFYGGKIYGIDKEGREITSLLEDDNFRPLEHIPFITFEGKVAEHDQIIVLSHMNIPLANIEMTNRGRLIGKMIDSDVPFGKTWGIDNFAMCRLLEPSELPQEARRLSYSTKEAKLYLELKHHPTLPDLGRPPSREGFNLLETNRTWIGLDNAHLHTLIDNLYTARFFVRKGYAYHYTPEGPDLKSGGVYLDKLVPDGCYEFINGVAYEIGFGAITHTLPPTHPLYPQRLKVLKTLYNSGIDFYPISTKSEESGRFPARYAYFRDGTLYTLGKPLFEKGDPSLARFQEKESQREKLDSRYAAFLDRGPPLKDGHLDKEFIRTYGLPIKEKHYLLLGDNHAMSNDSRFFGAVPQKNLQGSPALIFWPPGDRWGRPSQPSYPFFRASNMFILTTALIVGGISLWLLQRRTSHKTFQKRKTRRIKKQNL